MKKASALRALLMAGALWPSATLFGQGFIIFNNRATSGTPAPVVAPVFDYDPSCPTCQKYGNPSFIWNGSNGPSPMPSGTQTYRGAPLTGTGFSAAIWGVVDDPNSSNDDALLADLSRTPDMIVPFRVSTRQTEVGFWSNSIATIAAVASDPAIHGRFVVRVWNNQGGTLDTWDKVAARAFSGGALDWGESTHFTVNAQLGGGFIASPNLAGFESFQLVATPEPSTLLILAVAASFFVGVRLLRRQRSNQSSHS